MIQAFFTGANGIRSQQTSLDVIANNISNIGTTGYKQSRTDFKDALYNRMINPVSNGAEMDLQHGLGVIPLQSNRIFTQGAVTTTDRALDFMIDGDGFFTIEGDDGELFFTRDGSFELSVEEGEDVGYLVTNQGRYVLDDNGNRITFPGNYQDMTVSEEGYLLFTNAEGEIENPDLRIGVVNFINPVGLGVSGNNLFVVSENSGDPQYMDAPKVYNKRLEASNVDYAQEVTRMIRTQRAYQLASRALSTADQMAGLANSIRQ